MAVSRTRDWARARRLLTAAPQRLQAAIGTAVRQEAHALRNDIVQGLTSQAPGGEPLKPPSPLTIAARQLEGFGGTKALIVRGDLRNSITVVKQGETVFVGVLRSAKAGGGQSLANVAAIHEFGSRPIVLKLTPKVRRFLHAAFRAAGLDAPAGDRPSTGIAVIKIPARPFLAPVFETFGKPADVSRRFLDRVAQNLGGDFGRT